MSKKVKRWIKFSSVTKKETKQEQFSNGENKDQKFALAQKSELQIRRLVKMFNRNVNIYILDLEEGNGLKV